MDDLFNVLAEPIRRDILVRLRNAAPGDVPVGDLVTTLGLSQPTVSKHLKVLRDSGLVSVREDGQHRLYRLNSDPLAAVEGWIVSMNANPSEALRQDSRTVPSLFGDVDFEALGRSVGRFAASIVPPPRVTRPESR